VADSEAMAGVLKEQGHEIVESLENAEIVVVNSCTVKHSAENKLYHFIETCSRPCIVAGCVPEAQPELLKTKLKTYSVIGIKQISHIGEVIEKTLEGEVVHFIGKTESVPRESLPKCRSKSIIEIVPINHGCLGSCTYCKTKQARGNLQSFSQTEILRQIRDGVETGIKQVWITSQDTGAYGQEKDDDYKLPKLLRDVCEIKSDFHVRVGMCNPNWAKSFLPELIEALKHPKMFKFVHIPVQSGNNRILKEMNRKYTVEDYIEVVERLRQEIPDINITTDIIVGFPGETEEEFQDSVKLIEKTQPNAVNISRFWPRPGTLAAKMDQLDVFVVKSRSKTLMDTFLKIAKEENKKWIGREFSIIIDEKGADDSWIGRNDSYKQVIVKGEYKLGEKVEVKIKKVSSFDLRDC